MIYLVGNDEFYAPIYHIARDAVGFIFVYSPASRRSFRVAQEFYRLIRELRPGDCVLPIFIHLVAVCNTTHPPSTNATNEPRRPVEPGPKEPVPFQEDGVPRAGVHLGPKEPSEAAKKPPHADEAPDVVTREEGVAMAQLWRCEFFEMSTLGTQDLERLLHDHVRGMREAYRVAKLKQRRESNEAGSWRRNLRRWRGRWGQRNGDCTVM